MSTLKQIVDDILTTWGGGRRSANELPDRNYLIYKVLEYRAMYIRRDVEKNKVISNLIEQDLGCVELEDVDAAECCDVEVGCTVKKTTVDIPQPLRFNTRDAITYVGSIDKKRSFKIIRPYEAKWVTYNKYTPKVDRAYYLNNRIYIISNPILERVNIRGVFFDPRDLRTFTCEDAECYTEDSRFPIGDDMLQSIVMEILTKELGLGKEDIQNNLRDDKAILNN